MSTVVVAARVDRTESEGPGARFAIWVQGCSIRCPGCCNPEMFAARGGSEVDAMDLASEILAAHASAPLEGVTFLGGEPFEQAAALAVVAGRVGAAGLSVMTFTGNVRGDLERSSDEGVKALLAATDLLADGPFEKDRPGSRYRWLGSQNQALHVLTDRYRADDPRFFAPNTVELKLSREGLVVSGWAPSAMKLGFERLSRR